MQLELKKKKNEKWKIHWLEIIFKWRILFFLEFQIQRKFLQYTRVLLCPYLLIHRLVFFGNHENYAVLVKFFANFERVYQRYKDNLGFIKLKKLWNPLKGC